MIEWPRNRGRVIIFTSSLNADWNDWPRTLSYPPFVQELLRFAVAGGTRQTVAAGEPLEEYVPANFVGLSATVTLEDGTAAETVPVVSQDEAGLVRLPSAERSGVYRVSVAGRHDSLFAVNVPVVSPTGGAESDLRRLTGADFKAAAADADIQVVADVSEIQHRPAAAVAGDGGEPAAVEPRGPAVAPRRPVPGPGAHPRRNGLGLAVRLGPGRGRARPHAGPADALAGAAVVPAVGRAHRRRRGGHSRHPDRRVPRVPSDLGRAPVEQWVGVPPAGPGEGTRWRLETLNYVTGDAATDRWLVAGALVLAGLFVWRVYRHERPGATARTPPGRWRNPLLRLGTLRVGLIAVPLARRPAPSGPAGVRAGGLAGRGGRDRRLPEHGDRGHVPRPGRPGPGGRIEREWGARIAAPKIAALRDRADEINRAIAKDPSSADASRARDDLAQIEARVRDLKAPHRLNLVKAMLASGSGDWLQAFLRQRQMRVHVYRVSGQATRMAELSDPAQCEKLLDELMDVTPAGESSQLGTGGKNVLKTFRGGSLNAIVMFTDGVTTRGEDLPGAAQSAAGPASPSTWSGSATRPTARSNPE